MRNNVRDGGVSVKADRGHEARLALGVAIVLLTLLVLPACSGPATQPPRATGPPASSTPAPNPSIDVSSPPSASVATVIGSDPVDVARRQLAAEASQTAQRFSASLVVKVRDGGREWAHVTVRDTHVPPGFEIEHVLLVAARPREWQVLVHGSGLELPPKDAAFYGLSNDAARRLFPQP